jgi:geranylgeranyl diphosphate synthase type II
VLGKPVGRDAALGRPSAVGKLGLRSTLALLRRTVEEAEQAVPAVADPGAAGDLLREVFAPVLCATRSGGEEVSQ